MHQILTLSNRAAARMRELLDRSPPPQPLGLRIRVETRGCSGLSYRIDYAQELGEHDDVIEDKGVKILIDPKATLHVLGSHVDWCEDGLETGFRFENPNETSRCGCGESFSVA